MIPLRWKAFLIAHPKMVILREKLASIILLLVIFFGGIALTFLLFSNKSGTESQISVFDKIFRMSDHTTAPGVGQD